MIASAELIGQFLLLPAGVGAATALCASLAGLRAGGAAVTAALGYLVCLVVVLAAGGEGASAGFVLVLLAPAIVAGLGVAVASSLVVQHQLTRFLALGQASRKHRS